MSYAQDLFIDYLCDNAGLEYENKRSNAKMQFQIEVLTVTKSQQMSKANKPYTMVEVAFKKDGKVEGKKLLEFNAKEVCKALEGATTGSKFDIVSEKEGDYWQWKSAVPSGSVSASPAVSSSPAASGYSSTSSKSPVKGEWETREERAAKQIMIVKQSSLANAIATLKLDKVSPDRNQVLELAQAYTDWVLKTNTDIKQAAGVQDIIDMEDDISL